MGQPVSVIQRPSNTPGVTRFETNRSLTGMGKELYGSVDDIVLERPPDVLARRLFETGAVEEITIYGSVVAVKGDRARSDELQAIIEDLYLYWQPGDVPQVEG